MAPTRIADVIVPSVFNPYVVQRSMELSALVAAGIISNNPELDALATAGGRTVNMPFWNDLTGDDEVLSDTTALTPQNITSDQDVAALQLRGKAWAANDLAAALSGDDPMGQIANLVAAFWARKRQKVLLATLRGAFAAANMTGNVHDIATANEAASVTNSFTAETFIDAKGKLGDAADDNLSAIAVHSATFRSLEKQDLIEFVQPSTPGPLQATGVPTYQGRRVIVDDGMPVVNVAGTPAYNEYTSYLFGPGAIGLGNGAAPVPTETDRDSLAGDDILINRQHFLLHPRGVKWQGSPVGAAPSNAELETGTNWTRVYDTKNVRIVAFRHQVL